MKVLMIHDIGALIGGAEYSLLNIRRELSRRGHEVMMVTSDRPEPDSGISDYTFSSRDATVPGKLIHYLYNHSAKATIAYAIQAFQPQIIHVCTVTKVSPAGLKAARGTPTVMDVRDFSLMFPLLHKVLPKGDYCGLSDDSCCPQHAGYLRYYYDLLRVHLQRRRFDQISAFIVNSEYMKQIAEQLGMKPAVVLNSPIENIPEQLPKVQELGDSILYAGRLEPEKGILELLAGFEIVLKSLPDAKMLLAGDGVLKTELESYIQERMLGESVQMLGMLDKQDLQHLYSKVRAVAIPSLWPEPFGRVGPEAMAYGVPVIASGRGGMSDWLRDGENGLIVNPADTKGLADAMVRLLRDQALHKHLSQNARTSVSRFSVASYVDDLETLYRDVTANSKFLRSRKIQAL